MDKLMETIGRMDESEMEKILQAVRKRHAELYPECDLMIVSLEKNRNQNEYLNRMIEMLEKRKTP